MSELKPCPFCGGEAEIHHEAFETVTIKCKRCGVETLMYEDCPSSTAESKAIAVWNKRTSSYYVIGIDLANGKDMTVYGKRRESEVSNEAILPILR